LFQSKPYGLLRLIDEESNINNGTDQSMLEKLNHFLKNNEYYEIPQKRENVSQMIIIKIFIYLGIHCCTLCGQSQISNYGMNIYSSIIYQLFLKGFREKNKDLMRQDVLTALKNSKSAFVRELVGNDPVAVYRWAVLRCTFRALFAFRHAGRSMKRSGN
jgi:myosin-9